MKKIISFTLALVMLLLAFSVMPLVADGDNEIADYAVYLDNSVHLLFNFTDGRTEYVPVAAKEMGDLKAPSGFEAVYSVSDYAAGILSGFVQARAFEIASFGNAGLRCGVTIKGRKDSFCSERLTKQKNGLSH